MRIAVTLSAVYSHSRLLLNFKIATVKAQIKYAANQEKRVHNHRLRLEKKQGRELPWIGAGDEWESQGEKGRGVLLQECPPGPCLPYLFFFVQYEFSLLLLMVWLLFY